VLFDAAALADEIMKLDRASPGLPWLSCATSSA
jgi:hypothetical protein